MSSSSVHALRLVVPIALAGSIILFVLLAGLCWLVIYQHRSKRRAEKLSLGVCSLLFSRLEIAEVADFQLAQVAPSLLLLPPYNDGRLGLLLLRLPPKAPLSLPGATTLKAASALPAQPRRRGEAGSDTRRQRWRCRRSEEEAKRRRGKGLSRDTSCIAAELLSNRSAEFVQSSIAVSSRTRID
jgi:hypothetical protein